MLVERTSRYSSDPFKSILANGLVLNEKSHTENPQKIAAAMAALRWSPRKLAHIKGNNDLPPSDGAKGKLGNADLKEEHHAEKKAFG